MKKRKMVPLAGIEHQYRALSSRLVFFGPPVVGAFPLYYLIL
jgi:hypothetical protein